MARQQLPPQIRKIEVRDRSTGKLVVRYQVTVDAGLNPETNKRRQIRRRFATEKAAREELSKVQGGVTAGTYVHANKMTVDEACDAWLASKHSLKPSTLRGHKVNLGPLRDELGSIPVQKLSKADLDTLVGRLRRGEVEGRKKWSPRSCNYMLYLATAVLDDQVAQGNVVRNVARLVDRVAGDAETFRTLTDKEMFRILDHECRDRHLWTLALYGLRRGEIAGLRWHNVDLKAKTVTIAENRVAVGRDIVAGTPKSKASNRTLPLPDEVVDVLRSARKRQAEERLAFGAGYGSGEYVASDETGQPYHPNLLTFRWGLMLDGLGIERVRLHDARHSCATLMHLRNVPIAVIAAWLGHASAAFTMSVYAHSQDDALRSAASSFERVVTTRDTETGEKR
ncbi:site-specific integrase [Mycolicibacterium sp. PAM1]|uniref:site-specific integrase n=1 Tax=Mycolicibacterium sp. PAM1 TaxID=2853535 RepID=UPI001C3E7613|nr:tyrosine-type recombinase/integrase [Mycolicibacterium sp. PAM1]MBV5244193.1 site-specific integrase [Mycolicibacterium sp. PAM1]